jgi:hypothetical protein
MLFDEVDCQLKRAPVYQSREPELFGDRDETPAVTWLPSGLFIRNRHS